MVAKKTLSYLILCLILLLSMNTQSQISFFSNTDTIRGIKSFPQCSFKRSVRQLSYDPYSQSDIANYLNIRDNMPEGRKDTTLGSRDVTSINLPKTGAPIVVFPSPNSSALTNNIREDVDLYTGKLNVSIPIYNLKSYKIEVPVRLTCNSSANKVNTIASWVGLGWSLHAGGTISRVMKGLPDEYDGIIQIEGGDVPASGFLSKGHLAIENDFLPRSTGEKKQIVDNSAMTGDLSSYHNSPEAWDTQPDEFYFSFGNYSGKFVFDNNGNIRTIPYFDFNITYEIKTFDNNPYIIKFEIITPDGYQYIFGDEYLLSVERSQQQIVTHNIIYYYDYLNQANQVINNINYLVDLYGQAPHPFEQVTVQSTIYPKFTSSWHLRRIQSPDGDFVEFSYESSDNLIKYATDRTENYKFPNLRYDYHLFGNTLNPVAIKNAEDIHMDVIANLSLSEYFTILDNRRIRSIITKSGCKILFMPGEERQDLIDDVVLDKIDVYDYNDKIIKGFRLYYSYSDPESYPKIEYSLGHVFVYPNLVEAFYTADEWYHNYNFEQVASEYKRLFLMGISEIDKSGNQFLPYSFQYNTEILPRRSSYKQDYWGYYNANTQGLKIPRRQFTDMFGDPEWGINEDGIPTVFHNTLGANNNMGAKRNSNLNKAQAGVLKTIKYPTGLKKEFEYEINKNASGQNRGGLRIKIIKTYPDKSEPDVFYTDNYYYADGNEVTFRKYLHQLNSSPYSYSYDAFSSSSPSNAILLTKNGEVGYRNVTVSREKNEASNGKTTYRFISPSEIGNVKSNVYEVPGTTPLNSGNIPPFPFPEDLNNDYQRGLLEEKTQYNNDNELVKQINYFYELNPDNFEPLIIEGLNPGIYFKYSFNFSPVKHHRAGFYKLKSDWYYLDHIVTKDFPLSGSEHFLEKTTYYKYNDNNHLVNKVISENSGGTTLTKEFLYTVDYDPAEGDIYARAIKDLQDLHIIDVVVEQLTWASIKGENDECLISGMLNKFKDFGDGQSKQIRLFQTYSTEIDKPVPSEEFNYSSTSSGNFTFDENYYWRSSSYKYDEYGNIIQVTHRNDIPVAYNWGYNYTLPIAEVVNSEWKPYVNQYPETAHITSYTHEPLVGVTSITDPGGTPTYYEYDSFNRLKLIKDTHGNIVKKYTYNYGYDRSDIQVEILVEQNSINWCTVTFTALILNNYQPIESYIWNFGDGTTLEGGAQVTHKYAGGTYEVQLTVVDIFGVSKTVSKEIIVEKTALEAEIIPGEPPPYYYNTFVTFEVKIYEGGCFPISYNWEIWEDYQWLYLSGNQIVTFKIGEDNCPRLKLRCTITDDNGEQILLETPAYWIENCPY